MDNLGVIWVPDSGSRFVNNVVSFFRNWGTDHGAPRLHHVFISFITSSSVPASAKVVMFLPQSVCFFVSLLAELLNEVTKNVCKIFDRGMPYFLTADYIS